MTLRRQALAGVKWTTIATVGSTGLQMLQLVVLARLLRPDDFGLMGMVLVVVGFAQAYADAGISAALVHRQQVTQEQLSSLYWLNLMVGGAVCAVVWLGSPVIARLFHEPRLIPLLHAVSAVFVLLPLGKQFEILLQRDLRFDLLAGQDLAASVAGTGAAVGAALAGAGVWALVIGTIVTTAVRAAIVMYVGMREHRPTLHFRRGDLQGFVGFGAYQMGERTVNYIAERLDQILIGGMLGARALGFYNFAFNLTAQPVSRINPIVTKVAFPIFCKVQDDVLRLQRGYLTIVRLVASVNAPLLFGLVVLAPALIPTVFGATWSESIVPVQILSLVALGRTVGNPSGSLLLARGRADVGFKWNLLLLAVTIPCLWLGARVGGVVGVAASLLLIQVVLGGIAYVVLIRPQIGPCGREYGLAILKPASLAMVMAVLILILRGTAPSGEPASLLAAQVVVGSAAYLLLLWFFQRSTLKDLTAAMLGQV